MSSQCVTSHGQGKHDRKPTLHQPQVSSIVRVAKAPGGEIDTTVLFNHVLDIKCDHGSIVCHAWANSIAIALRTGKAGQGPTKLHDLSMYPAHSD